jgi:hypothetical protein
MSVNILLENSRKANLFPIDIYRQSLTLDFTKSSKIHLIVIIKINLLCLIYAHEQLKALLQILSSLSDSFNSSPFCVIV